MPVVWWPGHIRAASASPALASTLDIYATFLDLAGAMAALCDTWDVCNRWLRAMVGLLHAHMPTDRVMDSVSLLPLLIDNPQRTGGFDTLGRTSRRRQEMFLYNGCELAAVRKGPWKAHYSMSAPAGVSGLPRLPTQST
jgi:arylsulfatase A